MKYSQFIAAFIQKNEFSPLVSGEFMAGNNGLYSERETNFRNMCHWILLLLDVQDDSLGELRNLWIEKAIQNLLDNAPERGVYPARCSNKDSSNGLIGSAWILEGIVQIFLRGDISQTQRDTICLIVNSLVSSYPWDERLAIWPNIVEPDGKLLGVDRTFNHQLWFAASNAEVGEILGNAEALAHANKFVSTLNSLMKLNFHGLVYHTLGIYPHFHRTLIKRIISSAYRSEMNTKEYGYHAFNLLGFIRLYKVFGGSELEGIIAKLLKPCLTEDFWQNQEGNSFGSTYNPVGIEVAVAASYFSNDDLVLKGLNYHFKTHFDKDADVFFGGYDLPTLNARLYEMTYLHPDYKNRLIYSKKENEWSLNA